MKGDNSWIDYLMVGTVAVLIFVIAIGAIGQSVYFTFFN